MSAGRSRSTPGTGFVGLDPARDFDATEHARDEAGLSALGERRGGGGADAEAGGRYR